MRRHDGVRWILAKYQRSTHRTEATDGVDHRLEIFGRSGVHIENEAVLTVIR